jgi:hypothetical protein
MSALGGPFRTLGARSCEVCFTSISRHHQLDCLRPKSADSVAKVSLRHRTQIFRVLGAAIEQRCEGLHHPVMNSPATSVAGPGLRRSAVAACFVFKRKISRTAF